MKLKIFPFALTLGVFFAFLGLLAGIVYSFGGLIYDLLTIGLNYGTALAFGALLGIPIIFGTFGFGLGLILVILLRCYHYLFKTK